MTIFQRHCLALVLAVAAISGRLQAKDPASSSIVHASDFGAIPGDGRDDTLAFAQMFAAIAKFESPCTVVVDPGRYDFFPSQASQLSRYPSNLAEPNDPDQRKLISLDLRKLRDVDIQANGVEFLAHGEVTLLAIEACNNLSIRGLSIDYARPAVSEVEIIDRGQDFWVGQVNRSSTFVIESGNRLKWSGENWMYEANDPLSYACLFDPTSRAVRRLSHDEDPFFHYSGITEISPGVLKVVGRLPADFRTGEILQCRNIRRKEAAVWITSSSKVKVQDVAIYSTPGFSILAQMSSNITFERIHCIPRPDSGRSSAGWADFLHFSACAGAIEIRGCELIGTQDDAINVHGIYLRVLSHPSSNQLVLGFGHAQTWGFVPYLLNDRVAIVDRETLQVITTGIVKSASLTSPHELVLDLQHAVSFPGATSQCCVENLTRSPSVVISGCTIESIPTRGILVGSRSKIVVHKNRVGPGVTCALAVCPDARDWYESAPVGDLTIDENTFDRCGSPVLQVNASIATHAAPVHDLISVMDNEFIMSDGLALEESFVSRIRFIKNRIDAADATMTERSFIKTDGEGDVELLSNRVVAEQK